MLTQAILIGLIAAFGKFDCQLGTLYAFRPIVLCPLVGLVLGDLQSGLAIGASLELLFMGSISIGAYVPPDETIGGVLACAFAIQLGQSTEAAIALAMPIATLCLAIKNILNAALPILVDRADVFSGQGNLKGVYAMHFLIGLTGIIMAFLLCSLSFYLGADAIQGMLALGATTASVAYRLGRSADYVRDRAKAASIKTEVRASRDDFGQISIGQLVAIARYDGQPDRQKKLAQAAGTSNFDYILRNIERDDRDRQWIESVAALLGEPDNGINLIPDPEKPYSDPEWRYAGCMFPSTGTPEETIEKIREQNPAAVSIHMEQVYLWTRRDKTADAEEEARRAAEQAERDARRHALEEYAAASADKRMTWLHGHLHGIKRDKLIETTARLGLLQIIDPNPQGYTQALSTWNDAACGGEQFTTISGIEPERALAELRYHLDEPDWAVWAVQILAARIEWFIDPTDWTTVNDTSRRIPGYYQILQDLGYTPTDDETSHLDQLIAAITEADSDENEEDEENNQ